MADMDITNTEAFDPSELSPEDKDQVVGLNTSYIDIIIDSLKYATPQIAVPGTAPQMASNEVRAQVLTEKLRHNEGLQFITGEEIAFAYDSITNYQKVLKKQMSLHKKGTKEYKKAQRALEAIPKLMTSIFGNIILG